jgi:archaellum component FlaG (FlaF/FlaG flagellin family)
MGNAEQASITNVQFNSNVNVTVYIQNTGNSTVTITRASIDGHLTAINGQTFAVTKGNQSSLTLAPSVRHFINTAQYTVKLQTAKGNTHLHSNIQQLINTLTPLFWGSLFFWG